jgi:hypothetical protein
MLVGADIPGIDQPNATTNFQMFDRVLMSPPKGVAAREGDRFIAYREGDYVEDVGTVIVPTAILRVVRSPRDGDAAVVEVRELYGQLNSGQHVLPLDTTGAGATGTPEPVTSSRTAKVRSIVRESVLPSLNYYVQLLRPVRHVVDRRDEDRRRGAGLSSAHRAEDGHRPGHSGSADRDGAGSAGDTLRCHGEDHDAGTAGNPRRREHPGDGAHAVNGDAGHAPRNPVTRVRPLD